MTEVPVVRRRGLVAGEIEDAHVHRREGDISEVRGDFSRQQRLLAPRKYLLSKSNYDFGLNLGNISGNELELTRTSNKVNICQC